MTGRKSPLSGRIVSKYPFEMKMVQLPREMLKYMFLMEPLSSFLRPSSFSRTIELPPQIPLLSLAKSTATLMMP